MTKLNRSIERGLLVLETVSSNGPTSLAALSRTTGLPKATLLRICATLEQRRWLARRSANGRYQLGSAFPDQGSRPEGTHRLIEAGSEELLRLSEKTGLAADLAGEVGKGRVEIIDTTRVYKTHDLNPDCIGFRPSPFRSALGSAYLFALSPEARAGVVADLARNLPAKDRSAVDRLPQWLRDFQTRGYGIRQDGYWGRAVDYGALPSAIAVPITVAGRPVGAVNLVWPAEGEPVARVADEHLPDLKAAAASIARNMRGVIDSPG
ncbi:IclR family transcriptional regulator [Jannaschia rubra]|uniref:IclR family transcriptional regulator n=1 Tax=Jannaschia rubra TaxID=282197 RepID=UPI0006E1BA79|nr:helix-turn-helix domain-containing protein [Jannaschia rubra]